jgi:Zinc knuckle
MLMNIRFVPDKETFDVFKARIMKLILELKEMGEFVSPALQRYVLLRAMPTQYDALVQSLKINDSISFEDVCVHIKDHWQSELTRRTRGNVDYTDTSAESVMLSVTRGHTGQSRRRRPKCYTCGSRDHVARVCPERVGSSDEGSSSDSQREKYCAWCEKRGHVTRTCEKFQKAKAAAVNANFTCTEHEA